MRARVGRDGHWKSAPFKARKVVETGTDKDKDISPRVYSGSHHRLSNVWLGSDPAVLLHTPTRFIVHQMSETSKAESEGGARGGYRVWRSSRLKR